jgi:transcriptional regulator with XRE-family HTH domain
MKVTRSARWWLQRAAREEGRTIGAGASGPVATPGQSAAGAKASGAEESRIAFGRFISLIRRSRKLTVEELALKADLDVSELLIIEDDLRSLPEPRTVFRLAHFLDVPQGRLMQLAGLATPSDSRLRREAVRFAARSESTEALTTEQRAALEVFVAVLSEEPGEA